ncbi:MAG: serine hydrolase [Gemmatimonadota bacterium]
MNAMEHGCASGIRRDGSLVGRDGCAGTRGERRGWVQRRGARAVGLIVALGLAFATPPTLSAQAGSWDEFDAYVRRAVSDWRAPGLAIAVVKDGDLVFARGYGVQVAGGDAAVDERTRFAIGSTTKAMTVAALGILVDEGRLAWDDPVRRFLPWFELKDPWVTREVTVRDLLTHRAGLGNADYLWYERDASTEDIVRKLRFVEPAYSMRASFIYQNIMYAAAGLVVEAVSGMPWEAFVRARIFRPLGMEGTVPLLRELEGQENVAAPHALINDTLRVIENASVDPVAPAGAVWSSVYDMSLWLRMLLAGGVASDGERLLESATVEEFFRPQTLIPAGQFYPTQRLTRPAWMSYGLAWFQHDYRGHKVDFHTGSIDGMVAVAGLVRDLNLGVYVLANRDHVEVRHALMYRVFDRYLGGEPRDWSAELKVLYDSIAAEGKKAREAALARRVEGTHPAHELDAYVGSYASDLYGVLKITRDGDGLRADWGPGMKGTLTHWNFETFRITWDARWRGSELVTFLTGTDGGVEAARLGRMLLSAR